MQRQKEIKALRRAQELAGSILNPEVEAFKAAGGKVVGVFEPETPVEILEAMGLMPYVIRGTGATGTEFADAYFRQLTCECVRTAYNQVLEGEFDFLDGVILYNCCDHLRRIYDNWAVMPDSPAYSFFYIPKQRSERAFGFYKEEIDRVIAQTEERFGVKLTEEKLAAAIAESNKTRALVRELYDLRKGEEVYIDGAEVAAVLMAGGSIPRASYNALLRELIDELKANGETVKPYRRLFYTAGDANKPELLALIESQDAIIVADDLENGARMADVNICQKCAPMDALLDYYFWKKPAMPRLFGTQDARINRLLDKCNEYRCDGVVSVRLTMCDVWAFEQYLLLGALQEAKVPHLPLEVNYILDGAGQIRTRVQAFVENLAKRC